MSRQTRKAYANRLMRLRDDNRAEAKNSAEMVNAHYSQVWHNKPTHKNPRRRSTT